MQVKALEEQVAITLFDRSKRPPALNDAGRTLVAQAEEAECVPTRGSCNMAMGFSADVFERVRHGSLEAAIIRDLREPRTGLEGSPFARQSLVLIAPMDAPDLSAKGYPLPILLFAIRDRHGWGNSSTACSSNDDFAEAVTTMVHHGLGVSIVPLRLVGAPLPPPVRRLPFGRPK
jgi:DNA-binding transcriptional LysR family regulator